MLKSKGKKKSELMTIKPHSSREEIKKNLIAHLKQQGIQVKPSKKENVDVVLDDHAENSQIKETEQRHLAEKEKREREYAQHWNERERRYAKEQKSNANLILGLMGWGFAIIAGLAFNSMTLTWVLCAIFLGIGMFRK